MKYVIPVESYSRRHKGLVCMSTDTKVLQEFKLATDALQSVSQLARKVSKIHAKEGKR